MDKEDSCRDKKDSVKSSLPLHHIVAKPQSCIGEQCAPALSRGFFMYTGVHECTRHFRHKNAPNCENSGRFVYIFVYAFRKPLTLNVYCGERGYVTSYNKRTRLPNWVAWHLTAGHTKGSHNRRGMDFAEDEDVPAPRADDWDYYNSGYDRGHMCPAGDNKWSRDAMRQSFLFTNICPQDPGLNRGDWNEMENACRSWAREKGDIYIVCGPILHKGRHKTIGKHKVVVPDAFFKVVLCMNGNPKAIGFIYKNRDGNRPKGDYVNTVDEVERITGIDFFASLPDDVERAVESSADLDDWE